ncbi:MAG: hypothetical protein EA396_15010 [Anaerolineaceae bacterium]|nr:MAG: hypothetical protein EA396_15010 [Anaerolineaceae bacterium]
MLDANQPLPARPSILNNLTAANALVVVLLGMAILFGASFRFMANNWDDFVRFHPDERYLTGQIGPSLGRDLAICHDASPACMERMARVSDCQARYPESNGRGGFFDANCSAYNPENVALTQYVYGTLPLFIARLTAEAMVSQTDDSFWLSYSGFVFVWRALSALADTLVIVLVFLIGLRLHGKWIGVTAAILYAFAVFPIQQAHFGTADAITNLFVALAVYFLVRVGDSDNLWNYALFGVAVGAAVASRINVAPLAFVLAVPILIRIAPAFDPHLPSAERSRHIIRPLTGGIVAALLAMIAFRIGNPYAFVGPGFFGLGFNERFFQALDQAQFSVSGAMDWAPNWQWVNRTPYLFSLQNMILWGMGVAFGVTAWLACLWAAWRIVRGKVGALSQAGLVAWVLGYFAFAGGLWVMSMRYYLPLYPVLAVLAAWLLVSAMRGAWTERGWVARAAASSALVGVVGFTMLWGVMFTNIYRNQATFVQAGQYTWERVPGDFYMQIDGADETTPLVNVGLRHGGGGNVPLEDRLKHEATRLMPDVAVSQEFRVAVGGTVTEVHAHRLAAVRMDTASADDGFSQRLTHDAEPRAVRVTIADQHGNTLATGQIDGMFPAETHMLGERYTIPLDRPVNFETGGQYLFTVQASGGMMIASGAVMASELPWDEAVPPKVCYPLPDGMTLADNPPPGVYSFDECNALRTPAPWEGLVQIFNLDIAAGDNVIQRDRLITILDQTDYIWVNTNRRYDSQSRIPLRWPMTNAYYDALFSGELGFELERVFEETFQLGGLRVSSQHLPFYDSPAWLNEFEPEEAFHVYDHPVVMLFRKTDDYSPENTRLILRGVPLTRTDQVFESYNDPTIANILPLSSLEADEAPTHLMFTPEMRDLQRSGGTWAERFNVNSPVNQNQVLAVVVWWAAIIVLGLAVWPLLFVAFPALADRGYGFAKIIGMTLIAWLLWTLGTMRIPLWNQMGVALALLALAALSGVVAWRQRDKLLAYVALHWRLLLTIELLSLVLFVAFIGVRLTNPDLWHNIYGGEKPMDFAYFNGVLRSTIFPAIDPWFADGYINYYYFGFVIVSVPTLLTGIVPSVAYNLILPTLFSVTGLGAFSLAYSVVASWRTSSGQPADRPRRPLGNAYVAGVMALLLAVVLGNLDTARVFANGVAQIGGYEQPTGLIAYYDRQLRDEFIDTTGAPPTEEMTEVIRAEARDRAANANIFDRVGYEVSNVTGLVSGFVRGSQRMLFQNVPLNINASRWFWAPTRTIAEIPDSGDGAINEMPYFTFLYGDMHPHMMSMPLMLFALAFVFHEVLIAGRDRRRRAAWWALFLGALVIGLFQAVNTWETPTFMILGVLGLGYAWWLSWGRLTRDSLIAMVGRVGGFIVLAWLVALPFTWWFNSGLTEFKIWDGNKTPLWAYIQIHGFFLFLIASLLLWESGRWMAAVRLRDLRGKMGLVMLIAGGFFVVCLVALILAMIEYQVALIVLPAVALIALLFFRPGQSRAMQYVLVIAGLGLAITMGTEVITLRFDNGRQNSIFKFYIQVWLMFSVVGGVVVAWMLRHLSAWRAWLATGWLVVFVTLFFVAAMYPITATQGKAAFRFSHDVPLTLDGMEYMLYARHWEDGLSDPVELESDYRVIRWLQDNVRGTPVIMEALSGRVIYQWGNRIAINTGLPSVVGWDYHQRQQRSLEHLPALVANRRANVNAFYTTADMDDAVKILHHYDVGYVILADYERSRYDLFAGADGLMNGALQKFDDMTASGILRIVYQEGDATIYEVQRDALDAAFLARLLADEADEALWTEIE